MKLTDDTLMSKTMMTWTSAPNFEPFIFHPFRRSGAIKKFPAIGINQIGKREKGNLTMKPKYCFCKELLIL